MLDKLVMPVEIAYATKNLKSMPELPQVTIYIYIYIYIIILYIYIHAFITCSVSPNRDRHCYMTDVFFKGLSYSF